MASPATALAKNQRVLCPRCNHVLMNGRSNSLDQIAALSLTGLALLVMSVFFPFLAFESGGQSNSISLWSSAAGLFAADFAFLAVVMVLFVIFIPAAYLLALSILTCNLLLGNTPTWSIFIARLVTRLSPWAMVEVFIFGVLVALVKIISMADIVMGISFWAYVAFTVTFVRIYSLLDIHTLWGWTKNDH